MTRDFGNTELADEDEPDVKESDTVMRFLQSTRDVKLRYGGGFVQAIDGLRETGRAASSDWFFFVNGEESDAGAADRKLHPGDVVQWDYRDWAATMRDPGDRRRLPRTVRPRLRGREAAPCGSSASTRTRRAARRSRTAWPSRTSSPPARPRAVSSRGQVLRVIVGDWKRAARRARAPHPRAGAAAERRVRQVPRRRHRGSTCSTRTARRARPGGPGTGLVAATKLNQEETVTWIVTGTDDAGVAAAAKLLAPGTLRNAFAVAATSSRPGQAARCGGRRRVRLVPVYRPGSSALHAARARHRARSSSRSPSRA